MIYDEFQAITIAPNGDDLLLRERSLPAAVLRFLFGLFSLGVGLLVVIAFLSPEGPRPAGHGPSAWLGWGIIGLLVTALGLLPTAAGIGLIGLRSEYLVRKSERRLWSVTRLLGLVLRSRPYSFSDFQHIYIRHVRRGPFGGAWQFVIRCEGAAALVEIATVSKHQRARVVAESLAGQLGLPVRFACDEGRCEDAPT